MHQINRFASLFILLMLFGCIKPYNPHIDASVENKYVVSGRITDVEGWQEVEVSLSSPIGSPSFLPVSGCQVTVLDDKGHVFSLEEYTPGLYRVWMGQQYLTHGTSYQVQVTTPEGEELVSGFDTMPNGPPLDSVYYAIVDVPTSNPGFFLKGMQFYVNLNAVGDYSQYYKWDVVETWEYHTPHPLEYYYDGAHHQVIPPDSSKMVCWITGLVKNVFTVSTKNLTQNIYNKYPLQVVDGRHSSRLGILYSILVRQLALSEGAYNYWEQLRINSNEQGGLYEKQPLAIKGNLINRSNPERDVLGYFYATSESSRRYFYKDVKGIDLDFTNYCCEESLGKFGWKEFFKWEYPIYYYYNELGLLRILNGYCIDCRLQGGTTVKPEFWPE